MADAVHYENMADHLKHLTHLSIEIATLLRTKDKTEKRLAAAMRELADRQDILKMYYFAGEDEPKNETPNGS